MIFSKIVDGTGKKYQAKVLPNNSLFMSPSLNPVYNEEQKIIPFRQYFTLTGLSSGSSSMKVNGSSTNADFFIPSHTENDRYIVSVSILIADANATLNLFGTLAALTNGCQLLYTSTKTGNIYFHESLKTNFDIIRMCSGVPAMAGSTPSNAWLIGNAISASEAYLSTLEISKIMPPYGLKLDNGSNERIIFRIRDNVTGLDNFDCIAYGFERLPD